MTIQLVHEAMRLAIADTQEARDRLRTDRATADRRVGAFLGSGWQGVAAEAFAEAWADWTLAAEHVALGLDSMALLLEAHQRDMIESDQASQDRLDGIARLIVDRLG